MTKRLVEAMHGTVGVRSTVGVGTEVAAGKEERTIDGRRCILEMPIHADFAFIKAQTADELGNLTYRLAAQNFNPIMAMAAKTTIAEVEEIVPVGAIDPESVIDRFSIDDRTRAGGIALPCDGHRSDAVA